MNTSDRETVKAAYTMLLKSVFPAGSVLEFVRLQLMGGSNDYTKSLIVHVKPGTDQGDPTVLAEALIQFKKQLERQCFETYQNRGYLLEPVVKFLEPAFKFVEQ